MNAGNEEEQAATRQADSPTDGEMYCLGCRYPLHQLNTQACPECGKAFDASDPETFSRTESLRMAPEDERALAGVFAVWVCIAVIGPERIVDLGPMSDRLRTWAWTWDRVCELWWLFTIVPLAGGVLAAVSFRRSWLVRCVAWCSLAVLFYLAGRCGYGSWLTWR